MRNPRRRQRGYAMVGAGTSLRPEAILKGIVIPGAVGAVGAVGLDILWGYASPTISANFPSLSTGWLGLFVKLGVIGAVAYGARRLRPQWGRQIQNGAIGAAVLTLYTGVKGALQSVLPSTVPGLSGYMDFQSYALPRGMGAYMSRGGGLGDLSDMFSPAAVIQPMGTPVPRQFGEYMIPQRGMAGYIAAQPHVAGVGSGGLMGYDWQNDGM